MKFSLIIFCQIAVKEEPSPGNERHSRNYDQALLERTTVTYSVKPLRRPSDAHPSSCSYQKDLSPRSPILLFLPAQRVLRRSFSINSVGLSRQNRPSVPYTCYKYTTVLVNLFKKKHIPILPCPSRTLSPWRPTASKKPK